MAYYWQDQADDRTQAEVGGGGGMATNEVPNKGGGLPWAKIFSGGGAAVGAYASYADQQQRNEVARQNGGPQNYAGTSENNPWGPSTDYRLEAMRRAQQLLNGSGGGGGGGGGNRGGGGGGGGNGGWGSSTQLAAAMRDAALGGDPNVTAGANYLQNSLNDPYGGSQLLGRTFEAADGFSNPDANQYVGNMMNEWGGGGANPSALDLGSRDFMSRGGGGYGGGGGGGGGSNNPRVGVSADIRRMLDGQNTGNPELDAMIAAVNRGTTDSYQQGLAGLSAQSEGSGMYGSSDHQVADAAAATGFGRALSENETGIRYQDFSRQRDELMQAMGLGTQYDLGMAGIDAQSAASAASTGASARASMMSAQNQADSNAIQRELGNRGLMLQGMGLQNDMSQAGLGMMGSLSGMDVQNRQSMLGMIPGYHDIQMNDLQTAFGTNFGLENAQAQQRAQQQARADRNRQNAANQPWNNLARYMDVINGASSGYGTQTESGYRPGTQQPQGNAWMAGLQGGMAGAQVGNNLYQGWNS